MKPPTPFPGNGGRPAPPKVLLDAGNTQMIFSVAEQSGAHPDIVLNLLVRAGQSLLGQLITLLPLATGILETREQFPSGPPPEEKKQEPPEQSDESPEQFRERMQREAGLKPAQKSEDPS
jgi:hypothetical protein